MNQLNYFPVPESGCWLWMGSTTPDGYPVVWHKGKTVRAHRLSFYAANGYYPQVVAHRCDVPCCINPAHLFGTDQSGNIADKVRKKRQAYGEMVGTSKLAQSQVDEIKAADSSKGLSRMYGVSKQIIWRIRTGRQWRGV